jgi:hypothetical protein
MNNRPLSEKYIGKRLLISNYSVSCSDPTEAGILEVSPSGEYAKIQIKKADSTSYTKWCHVHDYVVLEELGSVMDKVSDVVEQFNRDLRETERKAREEFHKHSTSPTVKPSYWDTHPTSICSSDYADAPDWHATNYNSEVEKQKWVHGICNPPAKDAKEYVKDCKATGKRYNSVDQMMKDLMKQSKENK